MEPDLIERLRDMHGGIPTTYVGKLRAEAADEIERLRAALAFYADEENYRMGGPLDPNSGSFNGANRAKAALQ